MVGFGHPWQSNTTYSLILTIVVSYNYTLYILATYKISKDNTINIEVGGVTSGWLRVGTGGSPAGSLEDALCIFFCSECECVIQLYLLSQTIVSFGSCCYSLLVSLPVLGHCCKPEIDHPQQ